MTGTLEGGADGIAGNLLTACAGFLFGATSAMVTAANERDPPPAPASALSWSSPIPGDCTLWLCYSANFSSGWNGVDLKINPPGGRYGLSLHEVRLTGPDGQSATK
jgi:hypothetical protein